MKNKHKKKRKTLPFVKVHEDDIRVGDLVTSCYTAGDSHRDIMLYGNESNGYAHQGHLLFGEIGLVITVSDSVSHDLITVVTPSGCGGRTAKCFRRVP